MRPPLGFRVRCWVRRVVVMSARGPLAAGYRWLYRGVLFVVVRRLSVFPEVQALYLRRGGAKNEIRPGISDLDLGAVIGGGGGERVAAAYRQIARWVPFLEKDLNLYARETLAERAQRPPNRYRYSEARNSWKLLSGQPVMAGLPDWPVEELWCGLVRELKVWVSLFVEHLIVHPYRKHDHVFRNSLCAKLLGELVHFEQAWLHGRISYSRREAWRSLPPDHPWRGPVARAEAENFCSSSWELAEFSWRELVAWLDRFARALPEHAYGAATPFQRVELPERPVYLDFPTAEEVRMLPMDPQNPPRLSELSGQPAYLAWSHAAISLAVQTSCDEMLFTASQNPELFGGGPGSSRIFGDFFLTRWGDDARQPEGGLCVERFWKSCRLALCYLELGRGNLVVMDGPERLAARLAAEGFPMALGPVPQPGYLGPLWKSIREREPAPVCIVPSSPERLRVLAIVCNYNWIHTDQLVAMGRYFDLSVVAVGEWHAGSIANAVNWKLKLTSIGVPEEVGQQAWTEALRALVEQHQPQVVHMLYYHHEHLVPVVRPMLPPGCKLVFECRDPITTLEPGDFSKREIEARALRLADAFLVVSTATRDYYQALHGVHLERCLVVPHAFARRTMGVSQVARLSERDGRIHLALVGSAESNPAVSRYYGGIIEELTGVGVVVHSHFHDCGDDFYQRLATRLPDYHCHSTVPFRLDTGLSDLMARYDLTGVFHQLEAPENNEAEVLKVCLPTKAVSSWFHGGIPVACYGHYRGVLEHAPAGFVVDRPAQVARISAEELAEASRKVRSQRDLFSHEYHAARMASFFVNYLRSRARAGSQPCNRGHNSTAGRSSGSRQAAT